MLVDCEPLTDSRRAAYIQRVGYVSQSSYIFNGPVAENVAFSQWGKPYDEERVLLPEYTASDLEGAHGTAGKQAGYNMLPLGHDLY